MAALDINSKVKLNSGYEIPLLGFGKQSRSHAPHHHGTTGQIGYRHTHLFWHLTSIRQYVNAQNFQTTVPRDSYEKDIPLTRKFRCISDVGLSRFISAATADPSVAQQT